MNSKVIGISIRNKCSEAISEVSPKEWKQFSKKVFHSKRKDGSSFKNYFLTSKQTENNKNNSRFLSQREFKVVKREQKTVSNENTEQNRVESTEEKKGECQQHSRSHLTSPDMPVNKFVFQRNEQHKKFRVTEYQIVKRSISTFSNGYYMHTRCTSTFNAKENFIADNENAGKFWKKKTSVRVIDVPKKYIAQDDLTTDTKFDPKPEQFFCENESFSEKPVSIDKILDPSAKKFRNKQSDYKIVKRKNTVFKVKELNTKESSVDGINRNNNNSGKSHDRVNEINLQMLPLGLHKQIFPNGNRGSLSSEQANSMKQELKAFGLNVDGQTPIPNVDVEIPALEGKDVEEHFYNIASAQVKHYLKVVNELIRTVPLPPENWILQEGWTRYFEGWKVSAKK